MKILLVRHASAEDSHPLGDAARGLSAEGREKFRKRARKLARNFPIRRIVTSPLVRAVQTAEILADASEALEVIVRGELAGSEHDLVRLLDEFSSGTTLVGHNPSMSEAARLITGNSELPDMKKGCGWVVEKGSEHWEITWRSDV